MILDHLEALSEYQIFSFKLLFQEHLRGAEKWLE